MDPAVSRRREELIEQGRLVGSRDEAERYATKAARITKRRAIERDHREQ